MSRCWEIYAPVWLVSLARKQQVDHHWLPSALAACVLCLHESEAYVRFVDPSRPNQPGSVWQIRENLRLESPEEGTLLLDVLKGDRVGGVEFLDKL